MTEWIGYMAAFLTTACYVPQAMHVICTRVTAGISRTTYLMLFVGVFLWLVYGILIGSWPIILCNAVTFVLVSVILCIKLRLG